jgi:hypothetical protein
LVLLAAVAAVPSAADSTEGGRAAAAPGDGGRGTGSGSYDPTAVDGIDALANEVSVFQQWGRVGDVVAGVMDSKFCNNGDEIIPFLANPQTDHPFMVFNLFRLEDDRFEQIGQSWVKHTYGAADANGCGLGCQATPGSQSLGIGCSDIYNLNSNAAQTLMGPRSELDPWTGEFTFVGSHLDGHPGGGHNAIAHRLALHDDDLDDAQHPDASFFSEFYIVVLDDVDHWNNLSWESVGVTGSPGSTWFFNVSGAATVGPALDAWPGSAQTVIPPVPVNDGRTVLAHKVTNNGDGTWHYEYALYNLDLGRGVGSFSVPVLPTTEVTNVGFHAVQSAGEIFDNDPWTWIRAGSLLTWHTDPFSVDPSSNPLRWGTLYNFRFDADVPPVTSAATLGIYEPGTPDVFSGGAPAPASATACAVPDGQECDDGNACTADDVCFSEYCSGTLAAPGEVSPPGSPQPLLFHSATALSWEPAPASCAASFRLYRASLQELEIGEYGCLVEAAITTPGTSIGSEAPPSGVLWGYIATAVNVLGEGTLGDDSSGAERFPSSDCH